MAQPKKKISGVLGLDNISRAVKTNSAKVQTHEKYGRQLKVKGAVWEDDSISLDIYNPETKESLSLGKFWVDNYDNAPASELESVPAPVSTDNPDEDLPF